MKGFKAFGKDMICRGKQYAENTVFEEPTAEICKSGMHFCENPLDVLDYYPLIDKHGDIVEVAEVEALDECKTDDNKKYCTKKLKIGAKLLLKGFINAAVDFIYEKCTEKDTGDSAKLASSGDGSVIAGIGVNNAAKGKIGSWITLAEWEYDNSKSRLVPVCVKTEQIDGVRIKENTFYKLVDGKFQEV